MSVVMLSHKSNNKKLSIFVNKNICARNNDMIQLNMEVNNKEHLEQIQSIKYNDRSKLRQDRNLVGQRMTPDVEEQKPFTTIGEHSRNAVVKRRARMQPLIAGLQKWLAAKKERVQNKIAVDGATTDTSVQCERRLRRSTATESEEENMIRREKARLKKAERRAAEKEEEKLIRREKYRIMKAKQRAAQKEEVKLIRREKDRLMKAKRRAAQKEEVKLIRREKDRLMKAKRRAAEKERKRSEVLSIYSSGAEIGTVIDKVKEEDEDIAAETQRETEKTRSRKLKFAREKWAHKRAGETEEQRFSRLERERIQRARRVALETDEQQFIRLDRARIAAAAKRIVTEDLRLESIQVSADQQQQELMNFLTEVNKDQQADIDQSIDDDFQYFEIYECCPKELLDEKDFLATSTQRSTVVTRDSQIPSSDTQSDVLYNLLSSIHRKRQSAQPQRLSKHLSTITSRDYILSTIFWHKNRSHLVDA